MKKALLLVTTLAAGAAHAGCGDAVLLRVDTGTLLFEGTGAELHGAYAWEASPDGWVTHPVGGAELGFVQLGCGAADAACRGELRAFVALAGSGKALQFNGRTFQSGVRPEFLAPEGAVPSSETAPWPTIVSSSSNQALWTAVQSMPGADDTTGRRGCSATGVGLGAWLAVLQLIRVDRRRKMRRARRGQSS
jgi:hypothetical protein